MSQHWKNGVFCTNVSEVEAREIIRNARIAGCTVFDKTMPNQFSIDEPIKNKRRRRAR